MPSCLVFVTGASRGFGRSIAVELARGLATQGVAPTFALLARDGSGLVETSDAVRSAAEGCAVVSQSIDLSDLGTVHREFNAAIAAVQALNDASHRFDVAILVNNAGSLGPLVPVDRLAVAGGAASGSLAALKAAIDLNVTSVVWLTSLFLGELDSGRLVKPRAAAADAAVSAGPVSMMPHAIINVSSLCAIKPFSTNGVYCAGKAARDMLHAVVAGERSAAAAAPYPVKTLNYAPGPLDTEMQRELRECESTDAGIRAIYSKMKEEGKLIDPSVSAAKCVRLLLSGAFDSGAHIDFYDLP